MGSIKIYSFLLFCQSALTKKINEDDDFQGSKDLFLLCLSV